MIRHYGLIDDGNGGNVNSHLDLVSINYKVN